MFKFLKRSAAPEPTTPAPTRRAAAKSRAAEAAPLALPQLPEVTEGNEQSDWALWEDSVVALDSQMQSLGPSPSGYGKLEACSDYQDDLDAFSRVRKNDG
ncbi:MAG: hypothetical protein NDJ19_12180 [Ramlibacter sp.]|nr:hypothetical protein [Ramlibacter sp.]